MTALANANVFDVSVMSNRQRHARFRSAIQARTAACQNNERRARLSRRFATFDVNTPQRQEQARTAIELAVMHVFGVSHGAILTDTRGESRIANARQVAMYLAHVACGLSLTEVGQMFSRDRTTVAHGCLKVEMRRDNPQFDYALDLLGWAIPALVLRRTSATVQR